MSISNTITGHLPALQILLPLLGAPICALISSGRIARTLTIKLFALCTAVAFSLAIPLLTGAEAEAVTYAFGGWAAPAGITFTVTPASAVLLLILSCAGTATALHLLVSAVGPERTPVFSCLLLLCYAGLAGMTLTYDIFNFYVFLEISSLSTYALIALGRDRRALVSSYEYLILGSAGACFLLVGIALLYAMTGVLDMQLISQNLPRGEQDALIGASLGFIIIGLLMKIAAPPLHLWVVNAYTNASTATVAFLAASATKVALFATVKVLFVIYGADTAFVRFNMDLILGWIGVIALLAGAYMAAMQHNIKRIFAYSSIAWVGYIIIAISHGDRASLDIAFMILLHHAAVKSAALFCVDYLEKKCGGARLADMRGAYDDFPLPAIILTCMCLALAGVPGTSGFAVKWELLVYLANTGAWTQLFAVAVSSLLAFYYTWRIVETFWFERSLSRRETPVKTSPITLFIGLSGVVLTLWFGLFSGVLKHIGSAAASAFF